MQINLKIAGVTMDPARQRLLKFINNAKHTKELLLRSLQLCLELEPNNPHDTNAIIVKVYSIILKRWYTLGYIPKDYSETVAGLIRNNVNILTEMKDVGSFVPAGGSKTYYCAIRLTFRED